MPNANEAPVVATLDIRGTKYKVTCDARGQFRAPEWEGATIWGAATLDELRDRLMKATKRAALKVNIATTVIRSGKPYDLTITGRHQGNGKYLTRELGAFDTYGDIYKRFTPEDAAEWTRLDVAYTTAKARLERFQAARKLNVRAMLDAAEKGAELAPDDAPETDAADGAATE